MNSAFKKSTLLMLALTAMALLVSGCMESPQAVSPRKQSDQAMKTEVALLRQENRALKARQEESLKAMERLNKLLLKEKAEQRRFREMMATNFDLLEQSVALSISKTMGKKPVVEPSDLKLPPPARQEQTQQSAPDVSPPKPRVKTMARPQPRPVSRPASPNIIEAEPIIQETPRRPVSSISAGTVETVSTRVGDRPDASGTGRIVQDPDLNPPATPVSLTANRAAKPLYDRGFALFAGKNYTQAIDIYESFLKRYPSDIYSDNAQFWIGEAYFRQNRLAEAEMAYRKVLRNFDHRSTLEGFKTPDAILRIGQTWLKRNDSRQASLYFRNVSERFPQSSAGRMAQRELSTLSVNTATADSLKPPGT